MIEVIVKFTPKSGSENEVERILRSMIKPVTNEEGCHRYELYKKLNGAEFYLVEAYEDDEAIDAHRNSDHYIAYREAIKTLLDRDIDVSIVERLHS
ncbi:putative quinol monooxygenase [Cupriavidus numazuensis]|uniref:Monooxygenase n=1 Tax=Cupriavidus numazuensis TaxID=221992 RepID=A0ABN7Q9H3_9BURK|nr:putative quinol monooxygenase [Cupriavidus numazuensis]CAG2158151.1 Putative monooxygenase [Cupriavidus numazuensis]